MINDLTNVAATLRHVVGEEGGDGADGVLLEDGPAQGLVLPHLVPPPGVQSVAVAGGGGRVVALLSPHHLHLHRHHHHHHHHQHGQGHHHCQV